MISYKLVHNGSRYGSNAACFIKDFNNSVDQSLIPLFELFKRYRGLEKYFPKYEKGKIVKCVEGSIGLMCFKSQNYCRKFAKACEIFHVSKIIKVRINKKNIMDSKHIIRWCGDFPQRLIERKNQCKSETVPTPNGTIQVKQLYVME
jgi:hypothetical protein